jgi:hypothetical protein
MEKNRLKEIRHSDIFSHLPQMSYLPRWGVLALDVLLCSFAFVASLWVSSGLMGITNPEAHRIAIWAQYLIVMGIQIIAPVHGEMDCLQMAFAYQQARKGELARVPPLLKEIT